MKHESPYDWGDCLPTLMGSTVALRALTARDVPALFDIFSDAEVTRYWSWSAFERMDQASELFAEIQNGFLTKSLFQWGIVESGSDLVIGTTTLFHLSWAHRRAEIGFALLRSRWGRGLAGLAAGTLIDFAFDTLGLHRLEADVDPRNIASKKLLLGEGFREEGLLRERYHVNGELQDAALLGLLRSQRQRRRG
jgi:[ribosomal protein S5]-alanine N-acetyltransferase